MKTKWFLVISLMVVLAFAFAAVAPAAAQPALKPGGGNGADQVKESSNGVYIIQMVEEPVVAYDGSIPGLKATQPGLGAKIDPYSQTVTRYVAFLTDKHDKALKIVGGSKLYDYVYSFNGFAAQLSLEQANKLASSDGVLMVSPDELHTVDTSSTPSFLGLDAEDGLWEHLGGIGSGGEDVIIGIVDSGIWPESLSFTDRVDANGVPSAKGKKVYQQIPGWHGKCVPGEGWNAAYCNQKLIGAQYFNAAWGPGGIDAQRPWEFNSPRDYNGHGTHTSSTAGGNYGVPTTGPAAAFGSISGMAPRARIAMYKALWSLEDGSQASGYTSDLVAAIDQAVADGVDVINYSISGTQTNFLDPAQLSFLYAARAGVFVSASAGNSGPTTSTVAHPGPWLTTVAAGTHNRNGEGSLTLGNGETYYGASVATAVGPAPLVDAVNVGLAGADPGQVELCYIGTLDPALVAGKIVLCKRGVIARVDKSRAVELAGGVGMILYNSPDSSLNADFHFVPSVHVNQADGLAIKAYIAAMGAGATATINSATIVYNTPAPFTASFSSRGPLRAGDGDLLKPDLMAPGQDILAAVAPPGNAGRNFNLYSGTSMSAPHVAGVAALLKDLHPDWSPMAIKSALMTSAYNILDGPATNPLVIFRMGAGHINPNAAADPGLIYDSGWYDWLAFLCGTTTGVSPATCTALEAMGYSTEPSNLNVPSIAIGALAGTQTVTRSVENLYGETSTYIASVEGMAGIDVVVEPDTLTLDPVEGAKFKVTFTTDTAALNSYTGGFLTWSDEHGHVVRIPMVVKPVALAAPVEVFGNGDALSFDVTFGYTGNFDAAARGLVPAVTFTNTIPDDPTDTFAPGGPGTQSYDIVVPAGTSYFRAALFDEYTDGADDLDLYVYLGGTQVGSSGSGTSAEVVNLLNPAAGTYTVWVHGWGTDGPDAVYTLFTWVLGTTAAGNMTVTAPATAVIGETSTIDLTFSGLSPATKYLGSIAYSDGVSPLLLNPTIVRIDTP